MLSDDIQKTLGDLRLNKSKLMKFGGIVAGAIILTTMFYMALNWRTANPENTRGNARAVAMATNGAAPQMAPQADPNQNTGAQAAGGRYIAGGQAICSMCGHTGLPVWFKGVPHCPICGAVMNINSAGANPMDNPACRPGGALAGGPMCATGGQPNAYANGGQGSPYPVAGGGQFGAGGGMGMQRRTAPNYANAAPQNVGQYPQYPQMRQYPQGGQYQQAGQVPQGGQYQQAGQVPQGGQYQQAGQVPQGGQYQQAGQYPQGGQYPQAGQIPQGGQYQPAGQYPQGGGQQYQPAGPNPQMGMNGALGGQNQAVQ